MTESKTVTWTNAVFGGKVQKFSLIPGNWELLKELESAAGCGIGTLIRNIATSNYKIADIREVIRLGLIGGGMTPTGAYTAMLRYFDLDPVGTHVGLALEILHAAMFGFTLEQAEAISTYEPDEPEAVDDPA
jgi:hypothetical protein